MSTLRRGTIPCFLVILALGLVSIPMQTRAQGTPAASSAPSFLLEPVGQDGTYFTVEQETRRGGCSWSALSAGLHRDGDEAEGQYDEEARDRSAP